MSPILFLLVLLSSSSIYVYTEPHSNQYKLEFISTVFRHGDRSPVAAFPNSKYQESFWPQGFGQLSATGMRQEYHLGELFRSLYIDTGFIQRNYSRRQVYIRSTDYDRTLMSGESMLAGLFPPDDDKKFNPDLPWQPISVHTVPEHLDGLLLGYTIDCPEFKRQLKLDRVTTDYKKTEERHQDLFDRLEELTGEEYYDVFNIDDLTDELIAERAHNLTMPSWYSDDLLDNQLMPLLHYRQQLFANTFIKRKLTGGLWVNEVITNMRNKANGQKDMKDLKAIFYSAHDTSISSVMSVFEIFDGLVPPYSSAFAVELYSSENEYFVKFRYRNDTFSDTFHHLKHPRCSRDPCPLDELVRLVEPYMIKDMEEWESLCQREDGPVADTSSCTVTITYAYGVVLIVTLIAMISYIISLRRQLQMYQKPQEHHSL